MRTYKEKDYAEREKAISGIDVMYPDAHTEPELSYSKGCTFEFVFKADVMNYVPWIAVSRDGELVCEIRESNCIIFYN